MDNKNIALLTAWNLTFSDNKYYISSTHHAYLKYLSEHYQRVYLISTISLNNKNLNTAVVSFSNIIIIELPSIKGYVDSLKYIGKWYKAIKEIKNKVDYIYCRVPDPFSWMPRLCFGKPTIMHFVGDTIDATKHNEKWSKLKKYIMIAGYLPDYILTLIAARKSCVRVNGYHLVEKLKKWGVSSKPVISSTVSINDLNDIHTNLPIEKEIVHICYVGYIRYAKGMKCLMTFCDELNRKGINFKFHLIGNGEMLEDIKLFSKANNLEDNLIIYGRIDNRDVINKILRHSDLFFFPSLSEGSPRVIIEAMSQGIPVISTPVGSLPTTFTDGVDIRFFDFNNEKEAIRLVDDYMHNPHVFIKQRELAYKKVKDNYTIESFLSKVFKYEA